MVSIKKQFMMNKPKIAVVMSVYNGEKYLKEQIDSILSQNEVDVKLYIRDDGSSDSSCDIVKGYSDDRIVMMDSDSNIGVGRSFFTALFFAVNDEFQAEYFAFSDQDDIWLADKLKVSVNQICNYQDPALYCSNLILYKNNKNEGLFLKQKPDFEGALEAINKNKIAGCTMCFNRRLAKILTDYPLPGDDILNTRYHDTWVILTSIVYAKIVYDSSSYILHRIHTNNEYGEGEPPVLKRAFKAVCFFVKGWFNFVFGKLKYKDFKTLSKNYSYRIGFGYLKRTCRYFLDILNTYQGSDLKYIKMLADYQNSLKNRIAVIKNSNILKRKEESRLFFVFKVLINFI